MDNVIGAILSLIGVIIGALFVILNDWRKDERENKRLELSLKITEASNQKSISVQYITNKRVDWIFEVRNILSEYIALIQECANKKVHDKNTVIPEDILRELNVYLAKLRLLFNFAGEDDKKILDLLDRIKNNVSNSKFHPLDFQDDITLLTKYS